ncbi:MAG TPA: TetR/AcrR family transcriptional regulator [Steroidobacter sp.]
MSVTRHRAVRARKSGSAEEVIPRSERLENTRAAILESALEHFARDGFEGASVRKIAAQAGVNHGMIRHIYGSKEELWQEAITFLFERLDAAVNVDAEIASGMDDRTLFETYVRRYVHYCAAHPEHARIMIQQSAMAGPQLEWAAKRFIRARHMVMYAPMKRLREQGQLPDLDPISLTFCLAGSCQTYFLLAPEVRALAGRDVFSPEEVEHHAQTVIQLFLRS